MTVMSPAILDDIYGFRTLNCLAPLAQYERHTHPSSQLAPAVGQCAAALRIRCEGTPIPAPNSLL